MNQFFIPRPFFKPPKAMKVHELFELQDTHFVELSLICNAILKGEQISEFPIFASEKPEQNPTL